MSDRSVTVSVIVATRNRAASLERLLNSLQDDSSEVAAEIIVVDNGSSDPTPHVLARAETTSRYPFRVINEGRPGNSQAKNSGVAVAAGEILAFTDDDAVVRDGWIAALCGAFDEGTGAVGGRVLPKVLGTAPLWLAPLGPNPVLGWDYGAEPFDMDERPPFAINLAVRRSALPDPVEPFDTRLGHRPGLSAGFEETHLIRQILKRHRVVYAPTAVVEHVLDARTITYARMRRSFFQTGVGRAREQRVAGEKLSPYLSRVVLAARTYRWAVRLKRQNREAEDAPPAEVRQEFSAYAQAGERIEAAVGRAPGIADWCARNLVPAG